MTDWEHIYRNLRQALRFFGEATGKGEVRELDQAIAIYSGIEYGVFNISMLNAHTDDVQRSLDACASYFLPQARRWSIWVCEDALSYAELQTLRAGLAKHHLAEISRAPGMLLTEFAPPRRELPAIKCVPVDSEILRETFGGLAAVCFEIPAGVAREVYYPERAWNGLYRGYVGMVAGRPVGTVALVRTGGTLGVYSLGIDPESRCLGYGEALLREAVEGERAKGGVERVVLQSSESGQSLYRHMGFREVAQFSVHLKK
jgi:ribosomal protein S18 acetylase RimI-like enzyme